MAAEQLRENQVLSDDYCQLNREHLGEQKEWLDSVLRKVTDMDFNWELRTAVDNEKETCTSLAHILR
jgi:hypothetical protein